MNETLDWYLSLDVLQFLFYCKHSNRGKGDRGDIPNFLGTGAIFNIGNYHKSKV